MICILYFFMQTQMDWNYSALEDGAESEVDKNLPMIKSSEVLLPTTTRKFHPLYNACPKTTEKKWGKKLMHSNRGLPQNACLQSQKVTITIQHVIGQQSLGVQQLTRWCQFQNFCNRIIKIHVNYMCFYYPLAKMCF